MQQVIQLSERQQELVSRDGTRISFTKLGRGLPLILVDGALCYRRLGQSGGLAELLAKDFTVFTYDRRGRGLSGDAPSYSAEREVEDIAALLGEAGGKAYLWGMSSGGVLALNAANCLSGITKVAIYEAPLIVDGSRASTEEAWTQVAKAIQNDRRSEALKLFLKMVGAPAFAIAIMQITPIWRKLKAIAHTLPYDGEIVRNYQEGKPLPGGSWSGVTVPTLIMSGSKSPLWMRKGNETLARALPSARYLELKGQTHFLKPKAHVSTLVEFFGD